MKLSKTIFCFWLLVIAGCKENNKFEEKFDKPLWFNSIDAPEVNNSDEVSTLWQSEKRCCEDSATLLKNNRVFYKSCYNAISNNYNDEQLVVLCLWLMDSGADSNQRIELSKFLVENFSRHKNRVDDCANCMPGDTVARVTLELASYESRNNYSKKVAIERIENLLDSRSDEISYWVQAEIYEFLGDIYLEDGVTPERVNRYAKAYNKLNKIKEYNEPLASRFLPIEKRYQLLLSPPKAAEKISSQERPPIE